MRYQKVLFQYDPPTYKKCKPADPKSHCEVELSCENESAVVVLNEAEQGRVKVRSRLGHIAFNVHKDYLREPHFAYWDRTRFYYQIRLFGRKVLFPIFLYRPIPIKLNGIVIPIPVRITR